MENGNGKSPTWKIIAVSLCVILTALIGELYSNLRTEDASAKSDINTLQKEYTQMSANIIHICNATKANCDKSTYSAQ